VYESKQGVLECMRVWRMTRVYESKRGVLESMKYARSVGEYGG
jgi:hypothetical protein